MLFCCGNTNERRKEENASFFFPRDSRSGGESNSFFGEDREREREMEENKGPKSSGRTNGMWQGGKITSTCMARIVVGRADVSTSVILMITRGVDCPRMMYLSDRWKRGSPDPITTITPKTTTQVDIQSLPRTQLPDHAVHRVR